MRIRLRMAQININSVHQTITDCVFHVLSFFVHLVPRQFERMRQKEFNQAMASENSQRKFLTALRKPNTFIRRIFD